MITEACRKCEDRVEKDIIYTVGVVKNNILSNLSMVYGLDYAASEDVYTRIKKCYKFRYKFYTWCWICRNKWIG